MENSEENLKFHVYGHGREKKFYFSPCVQTWVFWLHASQALLPLDPWSSSVGTEDNRHNTVSGPLVVWKLYSSFVYQATKWTEVHFTTNQ